MLTALDAVRAVQRALCGDAVVSDAAQAEGLALTGRRAASVGGSVAEAGMAAAATGALEASCVHHLTQMPPGRPTIVLVASSAPQAIDDALLGHALSERLGRAVVALVPEPLASDLAVAALPAPAALNAVESALGRGEPLSLLETACPSRLAGDKTAKVAYVAAGPEVSHIPDEGARVITLRTLAPLPERFLAEALQGVERLVVTGEAIHVAAGIAGLSPSGCTVELQPHVPNVHPPGGWTHSLVATPPGPWAEALLRQVAASLSEAGPIRVGPRLAAAGDTLILSLATTASLGEVPSELLFAPSEAAAIAATLPPDGPLLLTPDAATAIAAVSALRAGDVASLCTPRSLLPDPTVQEIDFRPREARPVLPTSPVAVDLAAAASARAFHHQGPVAEDPGPALAHRPAAAATLLAELRAEPPAPIVITGDGATSVAATLRNALEASPSRALSDNIPRLAFGAMQAVATGSTSLRSAVGAAGAGLLTELAAPDGVGEELEAVIAALPEDARAVALNDELPLRLTLDELTAARRARRVTLRQETRKVAEDLRERLLNDHLASPAGRSTSSLVASLGGLAGRMKPAALAGSLPEAGGTTTYTAERRAELQGALDQLDAWLGGSLDIPSVALVSAEPPASLPGTAADVSLVSHPAPLAVAAGVFDGYAQRVAPLLAALDLGRRELADHPTVAGGDSRPARTWEQLGREELAYLPAVLVHVPDGGARDVDLSVLPSLLRSSRPVHVLLDGPLSLVRDDGQLAGYHTDPGLLAVAHREAGVLQTVLASADQLIAGLRRVAVATRPEVLLVRRATGTSLTALLRARAAVAGRACPALTYDPDAGDTWADRFDLGGNPDPAQAWPSSSLAVTSEAGEEQTLELPVTWADAAALDPAAARHVRGVTVDAWGEDQVPLSEWIAAARPGGESPGVPFIWLLGEDDVLTRGVVSRQLALACRDHQRAWRVAQELGGFDNAWASRAAEAARSAAVSEADAQRAELEAAHATALETTRTETARGAIGELAQRLMGLDVAGAAALAGSALRTSTTTPAAPTPTAEAHDESAAQVAVAEEPPADDGDDDDDGLDEAYIDTMLCTSCNDCRNINAELFLYNADKQAYLGDLSSGTYLEMVRAAEVCPAKCIHPGPPQPGDATATDAVLARAAALFGPAGAA